MPTYKAVFSLGRRVDGAMTEHSTEIVFQSATPKTAVADALRFYAGRQKTDEVFNAEDPYWSPLLCLKVHPYFVHPIDAGGQYHSGIGLSVFEWKCDHPGTLEGRAAAYIHG